MLLDFKSPYISDTAKLADGRDELALKGKTRKMQHWKLKKKHFWAFFLESVVKPCSVAIKFE